MRKGWKAIKVLFSVMIFILLARCSTFKTHNVVSNWLNRQIVVDGKADDWKGAQFFLEEEQLLLGFLNDQDFLYISFIAESPSSLAQIMMGGLTVWIDPKGGKEKNWGVKYPLGAGQGRMPFGRRFGPPEEEKQKEEMPAEFLKELEILKSNKEEPERMTLLQAKEQGLEVLATIERDFMVYELKIPLKPTEKNRLAIGVGPGQKIGIGFETFGFRMGNLARRMPGGGIRPGEGRGGFGMGREMPQPMKVWAIIRLSTGDTPGMTRPLGVSIKKE